MLLEQVQLAGAGDGLDAPVDVQFFKDPAVGPFDCIQGEEKSLIIAVLSGQRQTPCFAGLLMCEILTLCFQKLQFMDFMQVNASPKYTLFLVNKNEAELFQ